MRVAYLINQYPKVSHTFIRREIHALEARGAQVMRVALRGWDAEVADAQDEQERKQCLYLLQGAALGLLKGLLTQALARPAGLWRAGQRMQAFARGSDRAWLKHLASLAEACVLHQAMQAQGVTHVHAHFGTNSAEVASLASALGGVSYSFTVHGPEEFDRAPALHLGLKIEQAAFAVAVSQFGRSQLYRWSAPEHWPKLKVVHCALSDESYLADATQVQAQTQPELVCVGRLCEQKGPLILIAAAAELKARGVAFRLTLAGDGELRGAVEQAIAQSGLRDAVHITGWIDSARVRELLLNARALVLPSFAEGLPVVIMEAMAVGRPVISTYVAGIPELLRDGREGWLTPAGDVQALAGAMQACLEASPQTLLAMGQAGWQRVDARHRVGESADRLLRLFAQAQGGDAHRTSLGASVAAR